MISNLIYNLIKSMKFINDKILTNPIKKETCDLCKHKLDDRCFLTNEKLDNMTSCPRI